MHFISYKKIFTESINTINYEHIHIKVYLRKYCFCFISLITTEQKQCKTDKTFQTGQSSERLPNSLYFSRGETRSRQVLSLLSKFLFLHNKARTNPKLIPICNRLNFIVNAALSLFTCKSILIKVWIIGLAYLPPKWSVTCFLMWGVV